MSIYGHSASANGRRRERLLERLDFANRYGLKLRQGGDPQLQGVGERLAALRAAVRAHRDATASAAIPRRPADHVLYRLLD